MQGLLFQPCGGRRLFIIPAVLFAAVNNLRFAIIARVDPARQEKSVLCILKCLRLFVLGFGVTHDYFRWKKARFLISSMRPT